MMKVLIVEDEAIIRNGLAFSINWLEYGCIIAGLAEDGKAGLEMIIREKPDIVITDIRMPHMSGLEMIEEARKTNEFHSIILTSYAEFDYAKKAMSLMTSEYLMKPVDKEELISAIGEIAKDISKETRYEQMEKMVEDQKKGTKQNWEVLEQSVNHIDYYVKQTYDIIRNHFREKLSINDVAEKLEISSSYLSRKLRQNLNTTFVDMLNQYRVRQAVVMLKEKKMKVYEISDYLGFGDYKQFGTLFKKYTGFTPSDFMKE